MVTKLSSLGKTAEKIVTVSSYVAALPKPQGDVEVLRTFPNAYAAKGYADEKAKHDGCTVIVCKLKVVYTADNRGEVLT